MIRRRVVEAVDGTIHELLRRINDAVGLAGASLTFDDVELVTAAEEVMGWNGIFWGTSSNDGWYARFSAFGDPSSESVNSPPPPVQAAAVAEAATIVDGKCPHCGQPCPSYRKTCKYCRKPMKSA